MEGPAAAVSSFKKGGDEGVGGSGKVGYRGG